MDNQTTFVTNLLRFIETLHQNERYSDISFICQSKTIPGHAFVLDARGCSKKAITTHGSGRRIDLSAFASDLSLHFIAWLYTGEFSQWSDYEKLVGLLKIGLFVECRDFVDFYEDSLGSVLDLGNCLSIYKFACEYDLERVSKKTNEFILQHFNEIDSSDFLELNAEQLLELLDGRPASLIHELTRMQRTDAIELYLSKNRNKTYNIVNSLDDRGFSPLLYALQSHAKPLCDALVHFGAEVDQIVSEDGVSLPLLHVFLSRLDVFGVTFLLDHQCCVDLEAPQSQRNAMLALAATEALSQAMQNDGSWSQLAERIIRATKQLSKRDVDMNSPLHLCVLTENLDLFRLLVREEELWVLRSLRNCRGHSVTYLALIQSTEAFIDALFENRSEAERAEESLLARLLLADEVEAAERLLRKSKPDPNAAVPEQAEEGGAFHIAVARNLRSVALQLARNGADPNLVRAKPVPPPTAPNRPRKWPLTVAPPKSSNPFDLVMDQLPPRMDPDGIHADTEESEAKNNTFLDHRTPIHLAAEKGFGDLICLYLADDQLPQVDWPKADGEGNNALSLLLWSDELELAARILEVAPSSSLAVLAPNDDTLLTRAIALGKESVCTFLANCDGELTRRNGAQETPLQLLLEYISCEQNCGREDESFARMIRMICQTPSCDGKALCGRDGKLTSYPLLWLALMKGRLDVAEMLIDNGVDLNCWTVGHWPCETITCAITEHFYFSLLHRILCLGRVAEAMFLLSQ